MSKTHYLTLEVTEGDDECEVTEAGDAPVGRGETVHDAAIDYVERARAESKRKAVADGGSDA